MDIKQIINIFRRWLWLLIAGTILGGALGYYLSNRQTPVYQASTRFVILRAAQTTYDYYSYVDSQQLIGTYAQLLTTENLLYQASQELGFPVMKGQASAEQIGDTQFVQLTVRDTDPYKAAAIANGLVKVLIDQNDQLQSVRYDSAEMNLQDRIDNAQEQINLLETQISELSATAVEDEIAKVQAEMDSVQGQINEIKNQLNQIDPLSTLEADIAQRGALQARLDELTPILTLYQDFYTQLVVLGETDASQDLTPTQLDQLKTTLNLYQQIYLNSISSLETLRLAKAQNTPNVVQVETAVKPTSPISPRPMQSAMIAAVIGLLVTGLIVFLAEYMDDTLKTPDEIKAVLGVPVIGFIADLQKNPDGEEALGTYVARQPRSPVAEAFRSLRTNLEYTSIDHPLKTVLFTSSGEAEGKTTVVSNFAVVVAQSGKKVLVLESDLRRPRVHAMFNKPNRVGLSDVLAGKIAIRDVIKPIEQIPNLEIITCGTLPPNPSELIGSARMTQILTELETMYDFIVIDSPPTLVADAQILSNRVDGILFVVIPGKTRALAAARPLEQLNTIGAHILGVVVNRIPRTKDYYYGGYDYYSPYYRGSYYHKKSAEQGSDFAEAQESNPRHFFTSIGKKTKKSPDEEGKN